MKDTIILSFPNWIDSTFYPVTMSGGAWSPTLPLDNLRDPLLSAVARSATAEPASTTFDVDLGIPRTVRVIGMPQANVSRDCRWRARGSTVAGNFDEPVLDTGLLDWWPMIYPPGSLPWEHPSYWDGKIDAEMAKGYPMPATYVAPTAATAAYWRFEIFDPANPAGHVDIARLFMSQGWQPSTSFEYPAEIGWSDRTLMEETDGGERHYGVRRPRRKFGVKIVHLPIDEALVNAFEMQRRQGTHGQVLAILRPSDTVHMHRRSMLATMREPSPLEWPYRGHHDMPLILEEVL